MIHLCYFCLSKQVEKAFELKTNKQKSANKKHRAREPENPVSDWEPMQ